MFLFLPETHIHGEDAIRVRGYEISATLLVIMQSHHVYIVLLCF